MTQQMWGPALEAEVEYRRELASRAYQAGTPAPVRWTARIAVKAWERARSAATSRDEGPAATTTTTKSPARDGGRPTTVSRARDAVARLGDTLDTIAARTDAVAWDERIAGRSAQIQSALDALRPQDGLGRRAA